MTQPEDARPEADDDIERIDGNEKADERATVVQPGGNEEAPGRPAEKGRSRRPENERQ